jgi:hypothetical protein
MHPEKYKYLISMFYTIPHKFGRAERERERERERENFNYA